MASHGLKMDLSGKNIWHFTGNMKGHPWLADTNASMVHLAWLLFVACVAAKLI